LSGCRFLVHDTFIERYICFQAEHPDAASSLQTQLKKSKEAPTSGSPLRRISVPSLQGKLYKLWVGGGSGFRYVYYYHPGKSVVLPIFLSNEPRADFDWDTAPFQHIGERIVSDLLCGNFDKFTEPQVL
jgi:hypothetical protein